MSAESVKEIESAIIRDMDCGKITLEQGWRLLAHLTSIK